MLTGFLVYRDPNRGMDAIDIDAPTSQGTEVTQVISQIISLRDDNHIGFQIFDNDNWTFTQVVMFTDFVIE
jgi:hypothetical protein